MNLIKSGNESNSNKMQQLMFNIYYWLMFVIVTVLGIFILPLFLIVYVAFFRRTIDWTIRWAICIYGWILVKIVPFLTPVKVESQTGEIPLPAIFTPNHNSAIEPYLFGSLLTDICFVTTWPFKIPVYNLFMRLAGYINANDGWAEVLLKGADFLKAGTSIVIWPEGHRSRDGRLGRFKNGAFALSVKTGYPLIPVCILGAKEFLPPGKKLMNPTLIKMVLLDPIYPENHDDEQTEIIRLKNKAYEAINQKIQEENNRL